MKTLKQGDLVSYTNGEVWKVQKRGLMSPHNELAKKRNISLWVEIDLNELEAIHQN